jgi:two-component system chemotaxis response regulator CheB
VVLSGSLDDGAAGTVAVRGRGGTCLVQDFDEALYDGMPRSAAAAAGITEGVPLAKIPGLLSALAADPELAEAQEVTPLMDMETQMADLDPEAMHVAQRPGSPAGFGCPDCAGALYQIEEGNLRRFRCRVGHAWSPESLLARQTVALESALWMALRSLEEKAALNTDLSQRAAERGAERTAARFGENAQEAWRAAELVRRLVADLGRSAPGSEDVGKAL